MLHDVPEKDLVRLLHMRDAAREALQFMSGRKRSDLDADRMFFRAVVSCIQKIGKAAVKVSEPTRARLPGVDWRPIVSMRNRIIHVYFDVRPELVWQMLDRDLRPLLDQLEPVLPEGT